MAFLQFKKKKYVTLTVKDSVVLKKIDTSKIEAVKADKPISKKVERVIPEDEINLWVKCPECHETIYKSDVANNLKKCTNCGHHFGMTASERIALLIDDGTFKEHDANLTSGNPLEFPSYADKYKIAVDKTGMNDGVISGVGKLNGIKVAIAVMDFNFMGGSMGSVVGEKVTRTLERAAKNKIPAIVVSSSGGARMHEGIISLMQMAKTSAAAELLRNKGIPFISIPVDPTTGGVTASFAMLGDIIVTEPNALIAFAGPRVIEQTIKQQLPEGFQRGEFLLEHGMVDVITKREDMKETLYKILSCAV